VHKFIKLFFAILYLTFALTSFAEEKITKILIEGNQRIESSTVREYLVLKEGDMFSEHSESEAIKHLYATSLFEDISITFSGGVLKVHVKETPFVSKVYFSGNSKVKTHLLATEISTVAGESLKRSKLDADTEKIKEIYKRSGRFSVGVNPKVEQQGNNTVKVIFEIVEGPKTGVKSIYFAGNNNYSDSELRSIIMTKESRWFRFLESNDAYDPERIEYDKYLLAKFYNSVGFADFRVISVIADLLPTKEGFILTYSIDEGDKYQFGDIGFISKIKSINQAEVSKLIPKRKGDVFNLSAMESIAEKVEGYLASLGYPQVEVYPDIKPNKETRTVDVTIVVDHAEKIFINKINIEGNLKTEDRVIRRQLKIEEGDVYNRGKIEKGEQNIRNLDYFDKVAFKISPTEQKDKYDLNIDVEEKSTSSIGLDLGYNSSGGPFGRLAFLERNLFGTGKYLNAGAQVGKKSVNYYGGITDPNFLDKDLSLGVNLFRSENGRGSGFAKGEQNYSLVSTGAKTSLGYDITEDLFHEIEYSIKQDNLKTPITNSTSVFIIEQMGKFTTSSLANNLTYDKTDSRVLPKNGYLLNGSEEFAGLGGNTKFLKHEIDGKFFKSFSENKYTLKFSATAGHIMGVSGKKIRISDRFNLGDYSLRGFASGGIGPRDKITDEGFGGQKYYTLSSELSFPVGLPEEFNVTGSVFVDAGSLWDADSKAVTEDGFYNDKFLRTSVGFGVLWVTKITPIRVDYAFAVRKKKYDETQNFHIKFSAHF